MQVKLTSWNLYGQKNAGTTDSYRRLYATQWNQVGPSFIGEMGSICNSDRGWFNEQVASNNYFLGTYSNQPELYIYVAVVDQVGTFIYQIPFAQSNEIWPVLSRKAAACTLGARPNNSGPPCSDSTPYCALFLSWSTRKLQPRMQSKCPTRLV